MDSAGQVGAGSGSSGTGRGFRVTGGVRSVVQLAFDPFDKVPDIPDLAANRQGGIAL